MLHPTVNYDRRTYVLMPLQRGFTARMTAVENSHWSIRHAIDRYIAKAANGKVWVPTTLALFQISFATFDSLITVNIYVTVTIVEHMF